MVKATQDTDSARNIRSPFVKSVQLSQPIKLGGFTNKSKLLASDGDLTLSISNRIVTFTIKGQKLLIPFENVLYWEE